MIKKVNLNKIYNGECSHSIAFAVNLYYYPSDYNIRIAVLLLIAEHLFHTVDIV